MSMFKSKMTLDECQIHRAIRSFGALADNGLFELLGQYFTDRVWVDYTSAYGGEKTNPTKEQLMTDWASVLPGFEAICHRIYDVDILSITGNEGIASAKVNASHVLNSENFEIAGSYGFELQKVDGDWQISSLTFYKKEDNGNSHLLALASERVK